MTGVVWYFEPHGKLTPGSIYHGVQNTIWHPVVVLSNWFIGDVFPDDLTSFWSMISMILNLSLKINPVKYLH